MAVRDETRKISYSKRQTSQEINLKELLGRKPSPDEKRAFTQQAIERVIERTQSGKSLTGSNFKRYSEDYAERKGVSRSDVDMTLFGDMLLSIKELRARGNSVRFGIDGGVDALKSFNHNTGDTLPKRTWFGLTKKEARQIADQIKREQPAEQDDQDEEQSFVDAFSDRGEETQSLLRQIADRITLEVDNGEG